MILRQSNTVRAIRGAVITVIPLIAIAGFIALVFGAPEMRTATLMFVVMTMVIGLGVFSGNTGIVSFGHLSFVGLGAYVSGLLTIPVAKKAMMLPNLPELLGQAELSLLPAFLVTLVIAAIVAAITGLPIVRMGEASAVISTLGLLLIFHSVVVGAADFTRGSNAFLGVPRETNLVGALAVVVLSVIAARLFRDTIMGREMRAAQDDELAALSVGINVEKRKLQSWVLSAVIAAGAGVMLGHFLGAFSPTKFYFDDTLLILAMLIIGGMGTVTGAVVGTLLVTFVIEVLRRIEGGGEIVGIVLPEMFGLTMSGICLLILLAMYLRPKGLFARYEIDELILPGRTQCAVGVEPGVASEKVQAAELSVRGVSKSYSGVVALKDVSFDVRTGEIVGLIGPNGAGKTTLINMIMAADRPDVGRISFGGADVTQTAPNSIPALGLARTFQNIRLFSGFTVRQNIEIAAQAGSDTNDADAVVDNLIRQFDLTGQSGEPADALAYGQRRRLEIARALAVRPKIVLFDEPAAGMNPVETSELITTFRQIRDETGMGILVVEHDLHLIMRLCDRLIVLNKGEVIASGTPEEVRDDPAVIEAYLGPNFRHSKGER